MSEGFLSRWSRLKRVGGDARPADEAAGRPEREAAPGPAEASALPTAAPRRAEAERGAIEASQPIGSDSGSTGAAAADTAAGADSPARADGRREQSAAPALPSLDELTPQSDFRPFMQSGVEGVQRNAALKRLFADPHFNVMDGLDIYIDDYSKPDPMPAGMLRQLAQAHALRLFDDEDTPPERPAVADARAAQTEDRDIEGAAAAGADGANPDIARAGDAQPPYGESSSSDAGTGARTGNGEGAAPSVTAQSSVSAQPATPAAQGPEPDAASASS